jgi:hypothetical protein
MSNIYLIFNRFSFSVHLDHVQACGAGHSIEEVNCCPSSFSAAAGWDATTGLGSPNFAVLSNLVLNAEIPFPTVTAAAVLSTASPQSNSDSETKNIAIAGIVFGAVAFVVAALTLAYLFTRSTPPEKSQDEITKSLLAHT